MQKCFVEALPEEDLVLPQKIENFIEETSSRFLPVYTYVTNIEDELALTRRCARPMKDGDINWPETSHGYLPSVFEANYYGDVVIPTDVPRILKKHDVGTCILSGVNLRDCVWQSALSAQKHGYRTIILSDLCADSVGHHRSSMPIITPAYARDHGIEMMTSREFLSLRPEPSLSPVSKPVGHKL
jgi:hypothetical protein